MIVLMVIMITFIIISIVETGVRNIINFFNILLKSGKPFCPVKSYCSLFSHRRYNVIAVNSFSGSIVTY